MLEIQLINLAANASVAAAGFGCVWLILRGWDKSARVSFRHDVIPELLKGNRALGAYYGLRVAGALVFAGLIFSRVPA